MSTLIPKLTRAQFFAQLSIAGSSFILQKEVPTLSSTLAAFELQCSRGDENKILLGKFVAKDRQLQSLCWEALVFDTTEEFASQPSRVLAALEFAWERYEKVLAEHRSKE